MPPTQNVPGSSLLVVLPHQPHPPSSSQRCPLSQQPPRLLLLAAGPRTPPPLPRPLQPSSPPPLTSSFVTAHLLVTCSLLTCPPAAGRRPSSELLRTPSRALPASSRGAGLRGCSWLSGPLSPPRRRLGTPASQHLCLSGGPGGTSGCAVAPTADSGRGFPPQPHFLTMPSVTETSSAPLLQARSPLRDPHPRRHEPATNTGGAPGSRGPARTRFSCLTAPLDRERLSHSTGRRTFLGDAGREWQEPGLAPHCPGRLGHRGSAPGPPATDPPQDREGGIAASTVLSELGKGPSLSEPQFPQR